MAGRSVLIASVVAELWLFLKSSASPLVPLVPTDGWAASCSVSGTWSSSFPAVLEIFFA